MTRRRPPHPWRRRVIFQPGDIHIMRRIYALCAAASLSLSALAFTTPADAAFHLIRWEGTGFCQIWDESIPTTPYPSNYTAVTDSLPTFWDALAVKDGMLREGRCSL